MKLKKKNLKTVVILSGGMDSTTLLYQLLKTRTEVKAISFDYNQRHKVELEFAAKTCNKLGIDHQTIDITFLAKIADKSALTGNIKVPTGHYESENMKTTVVPNRNMIFASIAIAYAVNLDYDEIALGVHAGDHAIYPDCRPQFISALRKIAKVANYKAIKVYAPYLKIDKGDIAIIGKKLNVDYSLTQTCYEGKEKPCGKCGSCSERLEAFNKAKLNDPLIK